MRFPRLTNLFHRRVRSDPEIHRLASAPLAIPDTRPVSSSYIAEFTFPPSLSASESEVFNSFVPNGPVPFPTPRLPPLVLSPTLPVYVPPTDLATVQPTLRRASDPIEHHNQGVLSILTQRIRDLETALLEDYEASSSIASLEAALQAERTARAAAEATNATLTESVSSLQAEVMELRRDLFFALASPSTSTSAPSAMVSNSAASAMVSNAESRELSQHGDLTLVAERDRLRYFVELMVSVGAHKPVIEAAYQQLASGEDPEAALVDAIKSAAAQRDSVWRRILEPVVGERTQDEYLAQLRCTLDARRQTVDWRKKAIFWKGAAKNDGRHEETVTPSVSALSDVAVTLPQDRQDKVEHMTVQLRCGQLPLSVAHTVDRPVPEEVSADHEPSAGLLSSASFEEEAPVVLDTIPDDLPVACSEAFSASSSGGHSEMAEIAELDDRLVGPGTMPPDGSIPATSSSMVLPAVSSMSTARVSAYSNLAPLASETFRASHSIKSMPTRGARRGLTPSASASSQSSAKSRPRRAQVLAVAHPAITPSTSGHTTDPVIFVASPSGTHSMPADPPALPAHGSLPRALVDFGRGSDDDLVLVLSTDFSDTSYRTSPERCRSGSGSSTPTSAQSTPEKKSRLPVLMPGLRAIRRLSASIGNSRHPIVDSQNAPVLSELVSVAEESEKRGKKEKPGAGGRRRAQTVSVQGAGVELEKSTKLPMGRRLHRFGLGGQTERR